jgi:hypothetical protein
MSYGDTKARVLRYCKSKGLAVCMPTPKARDILVMDWRSGFGKHVAEGRIWADVEKQLIDWQRKEFGL